MIHNNEGYQFVINVFITSTEVLYQVHSVKTMIKILYEKHSSMVICVDSVVMILKSETKFCGDSHFMIFLSRQKKNSNLADNHPRDILTIS